MSKKECTRCGQCCSQMPCGVAFALFGDVRPCPALKMSDEIATCGLIDAASDYIYIGGFENERNDAVARLMKEYLGIGYGCCDSPTTRTIGAAMKQAFAKRKV